MRNLQITQIDNWKVDNSVYLCTQFEHGEGSFKVQWKNHAVHPKTCFKWSTLSTPWAKLLTHCGLVTYMATWIWANIGLGNGLVPWKITATCPGANEIINVFIQHLFCSAGSELGLGGILMKSHVYPILFKRDRSNKWKTLSQIWNKKLFMRLRFTVWSCVLSRSDNFCEIITLYVHAHFKTWWKKIYPYMTPNWLPG